MKVLFTHSYFLKLDVKQYQNKTPYAPLATLYAAALLRQNKFNVSLFDVQFCNSGHDIADTLTSTKPDVLVIYDDGFNYLSKMCLTNMRHAAFQMQQIAKLHGCTVIVSSSDATDNYEKYFDNGADYIIAGEAEYTLLDLVNAIKSRSNNFDSIGGLIYKKDNAVCKTAKRQVLKNLDELPFPAWDLIDIAAYKKIWLAKHGYFSLNFVTTRGCPYKCNWCAKPIYGNRYNSHSAKYIVDLIADLQQKYNFNHIWFADDIFGLKPNWLAEFAKLVDEQKIKFTYKIQSRADLLLEENAIKHLALSGCTNVWMGAESGSQKILDAMDKGITVGQIYEATNLLKKNNIQPALFLQFGYPGETLADIKLTTKMVHDLMPDDIGVSVSYPLPGTKFYETVKNELQQKANWNDSDDLDLMFKNIYNNNFYKQLHRHFHKSYRKKQAIQTFKKVFDNGVNKRSLKKIASLLYYIPVTFIEQQKLNRLTKAQ
ncbi:MAG TPA: radical SAM protein [Bacteroidia bacterium]|jgi:anaerobic magnesium-protoporphyrin IX monomethyl ester cyclase|nr:radical SAM protein [Bacteroidia bacterium]